MFKVKDGLYVEVFNMETNESVPVEGKVKDDLLAYVSTFTGHPPVAQHPSSDMTLVYEFTQKG